MSLSKSAHRWGLDRRRPGPRQLICFSSKFNVFAPSELGPEWRLRHTHKQIDKHKSGTKEIPSGFFAQPDAENVSAVLFSNSGTIPKFNRMGHQGAYHRHAVRMIRWGTSYRFDPNSAWPEMFLYEVGDPSQGLESWREGTVLFLNPRAKHPVPRGWLGASAEEYCRMAGSG
jgi:hypothetical protein